MPGRRDEGIVAGDVVLVKPGARIPVDGVVVEGHSFVDQATITGESMPAEKGNGTSLYAGTINKSGALEIRVDRMARDTTLGKIIDAVERADNPLLAAFIRVSSELTFILNSARLLPPVSSAKKLVQEITTQSSAVVGE